MVRAMIRFASRSALVFCVFVSSCALQAAPSSWMLGFESAYHDYSLAKTGLHKDLQGSSFGLRLGKNWRNLRYDTSLFVAYHTCPCGRDYIQGLEMDFRSYAMELLFKFNLKRELAFLKIHRSHLLQVPLSLKYDLSKGRSSGISATFLVGDSDSIDRINLRSQKVILSTGLVYNVFFKDVEYEELKEAPPTYIKSVNIGLLIAKPIWLKEKVDLTFHDGGANSSEEQSFHNITYSLVIDFVLAI